MDLKTSAEEMLTRHEDKRAKSYWDTAKPPRRTVAIGFNMDAPGAAGIFAALLPDVSFSRVYSGEDELTAAQIDKLFQYQFGRVMFSAKGLVGNFDSLPPIVQTVVVDMIFNMGEGGFGNFHKLRLALLQNDFVAAAEQMKKSLWYRETKSRAVEDVTDVGRARLAQNSTVTA